MYNDRMLLKKSVFLSGLINKKKFRNAFMMFLFDHKATCIGLS